MTTEQTPAVAALVANVKLTTLTAALRAAVAAQVASWAAVAMLEDMLSVGEDDDLAKRVAEQLGLLSALSRNDIYETDAENFLAAIQPTTI